jgi:carbon storage regulator
MLVLSRKAGESIVIGGNIVVTIVRVDGDVVKLGLAAPQDVAVHRKEVYEEIQRNNQAALTRQRQRVPPLNKPIPATQPSPPPSAVAPRPQAQTQS